MKKAPISTKIVQKRLLATFATLAVDISNKKHCEHQETQKFLVKTFFENPNGFCDIRI